MPWLLDIQTIYLQPEVESFPRGREILSAFPNAERVFSPLALENSRPPWF